MAASGTSSVTLLLACDAGDRASGARRVVRARAPPSSSAPDEGRAQHRAQRAELVGEPALRDDHPERARAPLLEVGAGDRQLERDLVAHDQRLVELVSILTVDRRSPEGKSLRSSAARSAARGPRPLPFDPAFASVMRYEAMSGPDRMMPGRPCAFATCSS